MSSTMYDNRNYSPAVTRPPPTSIDDTGNNSQHPANRRSLSDKLRNIFRGNSSSPNRTASNDRRPPPPTTPSVRQGSTTPNSGQSSTDATRLNAPIVHWPFGKKKSKLPATANTPTTNKKKIKASRKTNQTSSMEISNPIYQDENQSSIHGQVFSPRTPEQVHRNNERYQSSSSNYEISTSKGFRDYTFTDQPQYSHEVFVTNGDGFTHPTYTFDHSSSPSMNRQRSPNTNIEQHYYHDRSTPTVSMPRADIEVLPPPINPKILTEKPPISPASSSRPSSTINTNPTQQKNTSSSTLNKPSTDVVGTPKLNAPSIFFGSPSNKKKSKQTKSQPRVDGMSSSSSTINKLPQQNPIAPNRTWANTYGSLPDAEIIYGGSTTSLKSSKSKTKEYPGLSAIVQHHLRLPPVYYNERPAITSTIGTPQRPPRFETSTTTLNEYEETQGWPHPPINTGSTHSPSLHPRHDGYIRPMTPQKPSVQPDVGVIRVDIDDLRGRSPPPRSTRYDSPDSPPIYHSSTTIYARDKRQYVDGGEIRTWSSRENSTADDYNNSYRNPPYIRVQVNYKHEHETNGYDHEMISSKTKDNFNEYRYSPRAHEEQLYEREHKIIRDQEIQEERQYQEEHQRILEQEIQEEERYEVSYEYEQQHHHQQQQQYSHETKSHYDQLHSTSRYSNDIDDDQNLTYANLASTTRSVVSNERDKIYEQSSRSYTDSGRIQELLHTVAPVHSSEAIPHTYTVKRTDSYDGLGISISANSQTRLNHFIRDVEEGSPGYQVGLRKNDRIISVNGINVENVDFNNVLILIKQGLDNNNLELSVIHEPK